MPRHPRIPTYRLHKPTGQAVVTINGKDFYLGRHDSPKSHAAYKRMIAEWLANHQLELGPASSTRTINEILLAYIRHAEQYYRKHGKPTKQLARIQAAHRTGNGRTKNNSRLLVANSHSSKNKAAEQ